MTRDELRSVVATAVNELEGYAKDINEAIEALRKTQGQDVNFSTMESCKKVLDDSAKVDLKGTLTTVRKALYARSLVRAKELSK